MGFDSIEMDFRCTMRSISSSIERIITLQVGSLNWTHLVGNVYTREMERIRSNPGVFARSQQDLLYLLYLWTALYRPMQPTFHLGLRPMQMMQQKAGPSGALGWELGRGSR